MKNQLKNLEITVTKAAEMIRVSRRTLDRWVAAGDLPTQIRPGVFNYLAFCQAAIKKLDRQRSAKEQLTVERVRILRLNAEAKERERAKDEREWIDAALFSQKMREHLDVLRSELKRILLDEQPKALALNNEVGIREWNQQRYTTLCRRMQNASGKLNPAQQ